MGKTEKLEMIIEQSKAEKTNTICPLTNTNVLQCVYIYTYIYFFFQRAESGFVVNRNRYVIMSKNLS